MTTHTKHSEGFRFYFITITCYNWLPLIHEANLYPYFNTFFRNLSRKGLDISGYVIMPNHLHLLVHIINNDTNLNLIIGEGKRFLAYKIVKNLKRLKKYSILRELELAVPINEKRKGKKHQVFTYSFDAKGIEGNKNIENILEYIHQNPISGKWKLTNDFVKYPYSSAAFYEEGIKNVSHIVHFHDL